MKDYKRPWWLVVYKSRGLITTVQEEAHPGERIFTVRGEPLVHGLAWLIWGPVGALLTVALLTWLAIAYNVRAQPWAIRGLFIVAFVALPALIWGVFSFGVTLLSKGYLAAERQATTEACVIRLDQQQAALFYRTTRHPTAEKIPYTQIQRVRVSPGIGSRDVKSSRLVLETNEGPIILLGETLGALSQKNDLATEIERALEAIENESNHL